MSLKPPIEGSASLCTICQEICQRSVDVHVPGTVIQSIMEFTYQTLQVSIAQGCPLCLFHWDSMNPGDITLLEAFGCSTIQVKLVRIEGDPGICLFFEYNIKARPKIAFAHIICYLAFVEKDKLPSPHLLEGDTTNSTESFASIKRWLNACTNTHDRCRTRLNVESIFKPTRLLEVLANDLLRLREFGEIPEHPQYATLSHRWGEKIPLRLARANHDHLKQGFQVDILPKTFRDAIEVIRAIDVQYIWIDSLCIVQDDDLDWTREASRMDKIYSSSICCIAATDAYDSSDGLFSRRNTRKPSHSRMLQLHTNWNPDQQEYWYAANPHIFRHSIHESKLAARAWVLQERVLSPRIVHFTNGLLFWECDMLRACEAFPLGLPYEADEHPARRRPLDARPHELMAGTWESLVDAYTSAQLTKQDDKLFAISGLARRCGPPEEYIVGLWKPNLASQLCWFAQQFYLIKPKTWRAPTWSWLSLNGPLTYYSPVKSGDRATWKLLCSYLGADIQYTSDDRFGAVERGTLWVAAPVWRLDVQHPWERQLLGGWSYIYCIACDAVRLRVIVTMDLSAPPSGESITCLLVSFDDGRITGILIRNSDEPGRFERYGHFHLNSEDPEDTDLPPGPVKTWRERLEVIGQNIHSPDAFGAVHSMDDILDLPRYKIGLI